MPSISKTYESCGLERNPAQFEIRNQPIEIFTSGIVVDVEAVVEDAKVVEVVDVELEVVVDEVVEVDVVEEAEDFEPSGEDSASEAGSTESSLDKTNLSTIIGVVSFQFTFHVFILKPFMPEVELNK